MKLIVIPNFGERISPRIDCSESLQLINIEDNKVIKRETIKILAHNILDRINLLIKLKPDIVICDGISKLVQSRLAENKITVIPWVHGNIDEIINKYINGEIIPVRNL